MTLRVQCPKCDTRCQLDEQPQSSFPCPGCGTTLTQAMAVVETIAPASKPRKPLPVRAKPLEAVVVAQPPRPVSASAVHAGGTVRKVGRYAPEKALGKGAMGVVWLAHDPDLDRDLAIKVLPAEYSKDENRLKRFLREAQLAAKLHHPNTVTVHDVGTQNGEAFIAMELVDGGSLEKVLQQRGKLPWREATKAVRDAAAGLAAAHELGLIHRDVKPGNLMRTQKGVTKVVDFGLARALASGHAAYRACGDSGHAGLHGAGTVGGQGHRGGRPQRPVRPDLHLLSPADGPCAFRCEPNRWPWATSTATSLSPTRGKSVPDLPDGVLRILAKGSQKEPNQRYQSGGELVVAMDALLCSPDEMPALEPRRQQTAYPSQSPARPKTSPLHREDCRRGV